MVRSTLRSGARTTDLVQRLQVARRELALESTIAKLDRYDLLILDDIAYVTKDQAETSVLFELSHADGGEAGFLRTREPDDILEPLSSLRFSLLCPGAGSTGSNAQPVDEDVDKS